MTKPLLVVENLCVDYASASGPLRAVDHFSLTIHQDEIVGLVGESGCGKSTAALAIARLNRPPAFTSHGHITLNGYAWSQLSEAELRPHRWKDLSLVFQSAINALNPVLSVGQQLIDTLRAGGASRSAARARAEELLKMVNLPIDKFKSYSHQLSGGQRQRICIALSLAFNPKLIIMDEPTTALDLVTQKEILAEVMALKQRLRLSILFISHDLNLVASIADRVAIMYAGQIVETGNVKQVFNKPQHPYTRGLISSMLPLSSAGGKMSGITGEPPPINAMPTGCRFRERCYLSADACFGAPALKLISTDRDTRARCFRIGVDKPISLAASNQGNKPETSVQPANKVTRQLALEDVNFHVPGPRGRFFLRSKTQLLHDINFTLESGKITALVGESGSGKSTIARLLTQILIPSSGRIRLEPRDHNNTKGFHSTVQMVFQNPFDSLNPMHSVRYHLERPLQLHHSLSAEALLDRIRQLLDTVGLVPAQQMMDKLPHELSGGQKQRLSLARALAVNPDFIIADEPTSMLDVSIRLGILNLLKEFSAQGMGILLITHDLATASYLSDDILVLHQGRIVERGNTSDVIEQPQHSYTQRLLSARIDMNTNWEAVESQEASLKLCQT